MLFWWVNQNPTVLTDYITDLTTNVCNNLKSIFKPFKDNRKHNKTNLYFVKKAISMNSFNLFFGRLQIIQIFYNRQDQYRNTSTVGPLITGLLGTELRLENYLAR